MRKSISFLAIMAIMFSSVPVQATRGYRSVWVECENASIISGKWSVVSDNRASGNAVMQLDTVDAVPSEIRLNFNLSYDGEYEFFLLGTPGNVDWASRRQWKLNNGEYQTDHAINLGTGITAGSRSVSLTWQKLTTEELKKGNNTISFYADKLRSMSNDYCLSIIDTIAIVPADWKWVPDGIQTRPYDSTEIKMNVVSGKALKKELKQEEIFNVEVEYRLGAKTEAIPKLYAELSKEGSRISRDEHIPTLPLKAWGVGISQKETFSIKVPFDIADGEYEIRVGVERVNLEDGSESAVVDRVRIGKPREEIAPLVAEFSNLKIPENIKKDVPVEIDADFKLNREIGKAAKPYLAIWKDGLLYDVLEGDVPISDGNGKFSFKAVMKSDMPEGAYEATVGIHYVNSNTDDKTPIYISGGDPAKIKYHKPMSFGYYYSKETGREQFWYINQESTPIWNGEPYIPIGGMFVSSYIYRYKDGDDEGNKKRFLSDVEDLEKIRATGVNDLYINPVRSGDAVPAHAWKHLFDYLETEGWFYGIQGNVSNSGNEADLYYPRAVESLGRFEVKDVKSSGEVTLSVGKSFAASINNLISAIYIVINDENQTVVDSGNCELSFDSDDNVQFKANIKVENDQSHTVYFTPKIYGGIGRAKNYWKNPERFYDSIEKFAKGLEFGDNLRICVDVQGNEMGFYNQIESARIADEEFNELFKKWLENKYSTISALNAKWKTNPTLTSFDEAVNLIPVYTSVKDENNESYSIFVNDKTGEAYTVDSHTGVAWNDYLDARDDEYLKFHNLSADSFKSFIDVPTVYKHCSVNRRYLVNKEKTGGFDGLGCEAYGPTAKITRMAAMTGSMVDQMTRTGVKLVTETSDLENMTKKYESNQWGYPSEEVLVERFIGMLDAGAKGIYDFLLKDDEDLGGQIGKAYSWKNNPDTMEWAGHLNEMIDKNIDKYAYQKWSNENFYIYPSFKNWWYNPTERGAVQLLDDELRTSFLRTNGGVGNHISPTDSLDVDSRLIFINIQDGPYSNIFGPELSALMRNRPKDKRICILGHRNDIGTIPEIDKYFSNEKIVINEEENETVQILIPTSTSEILKTTEDGKPWALRDGELYIISSDKVMYFSETEGYVKYADELGVTDVSGLLTGDIESLNDGFADMNGHWAENDVNYMKKQGIAQGVGDNKFLPDAHITVAEFVALITRIMGYEKAGINSDCWYAEAMTQADENGLLTVDMKIDPERAIKREEMAYVAAKALGKADVDFDLKEFKDHDLISNDMRSEVAAAAELGIVEGMEDGTFRPSDNSTRAQAIVIAKRVMLKK